MEMDIERPLHATLADVEGLFPILFFFRSDAAQKREFGIFRYHLEGLIDRHLDRVLPLAAQNNRAVKTVLSSCRWNGAARGSKGSRRDGPWPCTWRPRWEGTLDDGTDAGRKSVGF
ncbi:hypothetical protein K438DRAFT_1766291 [Mycena galopus ATCC 62051]|nr:hypothetical protein K438DRAFT_1766291 [Mycena galopus ATCC 62051]